MSGISPLPESDTSKVAREIWGRFSVLGQRQKTLRFAYIGFSLDVVQLDILSP